MKLRIGVLCFLFLLFQLNLPAQHARSLYKINQVNDYSLNALMYQDSEELSWSSIIGANTNNYKTLNISSPKAILNETPLTENNAEYLYLKSSELVISKQIDSALTALKMAANIYSKQGNDYAVAKCMNGIGNIYWDQANHKDAVYYYSRALNIWKNKGKLDKIGESFINIGQVYISSDDYTTAMDYCYRALRIFTFLKLKEKISLAYNKIGLLFQFSGQYEKGIAYYNKALELDKELKNYLFISRDLNNIGNVYLIKGEKDKALQYFEKSLEICLQEDLESSCMDPLGNMGVCYLRMKQYDRALDYLNQSYLMAKKYDNQNCIISYLYFSGRLYVATGKPELAIQQFLKMDTSSLVKSTPGKVIDLYHSMAEAYLAMNDYKNALTYTNKYIALDDSVFTETQDRILKETEAKYETAIKEQKIIKMTEKAHLQEAQLKASRERVRYQIIIFCILVVVLGTGVYLYFVRIRRKQQETIKASIIEQDKIRFKAVIDAGEKESKRIAKDLHDSLGQMLSTAKMNLSGLNNSVYDQDDKQMYNNAVTLIDSACTEVRSISHNLMPTSLIRKGLIVAINELVRQLNDSKKLQVAFEVNGIQERLDEHMEFSVYRIIQEIMNNNIRHAEATAVDVFFEKTANEIILRITDNGKGFNPEIVYKSKGLGWMSILSRVNMLKGTIHIDSKPGVGSVITLNFPF